MNKQSVEQAAKEYEANQDKHFLHDNDYTAFKAGAEWHSKSAPPMNVGVSAGVWVKASDRLPKGDEPVFVRNIQSKHGGMIRFIELTGIENLEWLDEQASELPLLTANEVLKSTTEWIQFEQEMNEAPVLTNSDELLRMAARIIACFRNENPTKDSRLTKKSAEQWLAAMEEYKRQPAVPATGKNKPFIVANVREIFDAMETNNVSFSRGVELLNEVAAKYYLPLSPVLTAEEVKRQAIDFFYFAVEFTQNNIDWDGDFTNDQLWEQFKATIPPAPPASNQ